MLSIPVEPYLNEDTSTNNEVSMIWKIQNKVMSQRRYLMKMSSRCVLLDLNDVSQIKSCHNEDTHTWRCLKRSTAILSTPTLPQWTSALGVEVSHRRYPSKPDLGRGILKIWRVYWTKHTASLTRREPEDVSASEHVERAHNFSSWTKQTSS